jgi:hypothetical protein
MGNRTTVEIDKSQMSSGAVKSGEMKPKMNDRTDELEKDAPKPAMDDAEIDDNEMDDDSGM